MNSGQEADTMNLALRRPDRLPTPFVCARPALSTACLLAPSIALFACGGAVREQPAPTTAAAPGPIEEAAATAATCDYEEYESLLHDASGAWDALWERLDRDHVDGEPSFYVGDASALLELDELAEVHGRLSRLAEIAAACHLPPREGPALADRFAAIVEPYLADDADWTLDQQTQQRLTHEVYEIFDATRASLQAARRAREAIARGASGGSECERMTNVRAQEWSERVDEAQRTNDDEERNQLDRGTWDEALMSELMEELTDAMEVHTALLSSAPEGLARLRASRLWRRHASFAELERELVSLVALCAPQIGLGESQLTHLHAEGGVDS
jgi:hypothetical protein